MEVDESSSIDEITDKVAEFLNEASLISRESERLSKLRLVQEMILRKNTDLLDNFLDEVLAFQLDKSGEVRKFVISFIEDACKKDAEVIFKVIDNFRCLLFDENINVQKRAYLAMISIFKSTIKWISRHESQLDENHIQTWSSILDIKTHISAQLDSDNDGIRNTAIKFIEVLILLFSSRTKDSYVPGANENDFSVDQIEETTSNNSSLLVSTELIEEGRAHMQKLLDYTLSTHISSVNLIASISALSNIARQRPEFIEIVLDAYAKIIENMPPTLGKSQVSTVRKQLKLQVIMICKNSSSVDFHPQIASILADLGASNSEIARALPKSISSDAKKRPPSMSTEALSASALSKKPKSQLQSGSQTLTIKGKNDSSATITASSEPATVSKSAESIGLSLEAAADDLVVKLNQKENVTDLVIVTMAFLPEQIPSTFLASYKPVSNPGTTAQIKSLARMMAQQFSDAGLITLSQSSSTQPTSTTTVMESSSTTIAADTIDDLDQDDDAENDETSKFSPRKLSLDLSHREKLDSVSKKEPTVSGDKKQPANLLEKIKPVNIESIVAKKTSNKIFKLNEVTMNHVDQFNPASLQTLISQANQRVLEAEDTVPKGCKEANLVRKKILIDLTNIGDHENNLVKYIFDDPRKRMDISLLWVYSTYLKLRKRQLKLEQLVSVKTDDEMPDEDFSLEYERIIQEIGDIQMEYDNVLFKIFYGLQQRQEQKDMLFSRFICLVPFISDSGLNLLKRGCLDEENKLFNLQALNTLSDLIVTRYAQREDFLKILLDLTHVQQATIRESALGIALNLYERPSFRLMIQDFAVERLKNLMAPSPSAEIMEELGVNANQIAQWSEPLVKACLYLFIELMSVNTSVINSLADVYISSSSEVKRVILKTIDTPIKKIGMENGELMRFFQNFPPGSETLVLRIIHILTEKSLPSLELINKVRDLYATRLPDVRFLIPILTSLTKAEIIAALPQLIKLSQPVVKEVFNRLLGINVNLPIHKSPVSPAELLVALHQIETTSGDIKAIIYATSICFAETKIYTQEILAAVIKQLIDMNPIPTLYMRTIIQSLQVYPKLSSFVVIMMQRLIGKQIWKYPKIWEGFIKCCQLLKSISHQILLQNQQYLPAAQLKEIITQVPELKEHLRQHLQANPGQKSSLNKEVLELFETD